MTMESWPQSSSFSKRVSGVAADSRQSVGQLVAEGGHELADGHDRALWGGGYEEMGLCEEFKRRLRL